MDKTVIDSYPRYDSYKDSGVDWLGEIPEEWNLTPAFKFINENKLKNKGLTVDTVLSLSYGNILIKPKEKLTGLVPESFETYQIVEPNDIIIRCMDLQNDKTSLRIGLVKDKGIITSAYLALKVANSYLPEYLYYYLHSLDTSKAIYKMGTGLRQNLSFGDFKRFQVPNIPLKVQQSIVNFVKTKSAQIDQAITLKQQQIAKLEEYKQIVIQNAVTKGLNPDAPMKDSGVDWIGNIPTHWEIKKLKRVAIVNPSVRFNNLKYDEPVSFLPMEKVSVHGDIDCSLKRPLNEVKQGFTVFEKDDVILAKITPCFENGKGALLEKLDTPVGFGSTEFHVIRANKGIDKKYLYNITQSPIFLKVGEKMMVGSAGQKRVPTDFVSNYNISLPPLKEQLDINKFIENTTKKIQENIRVQRNQIDRLKEYKTILINQAVTGKIKVS